jgi:hypothetical protein
MFVAASLGVFECVEIDDEATKVVINRFHYHCGRRFDTQPLREVVESSTMSCDASNLILT